MKQVFALERLTPIQGQPVTLESGKLYKDEQGAISAELLLRSRADKAVSAVIVTLTGSDITGRELETTEHQYLDLSLSNGGETGLGELIQLKDNRVRRFDVRIDTVVYDDGSMWKREESAKSKAKASGKTKKPLIAVIVLMLAAALIFGGIQLSGNKAYPAKVGEIITVGHYPQTAEGTDNTPIEWLVLDVQDNKALLISRYGLDAQPYNKDDVDITWENCMLRAWLNDTFLNRAFSAEEQKAILTTTVDNSESQCYSGWSTSGGNDTQDRVFLLSYAETNKYFGVTYTDFNNTKSRVEPTAYAIKNGAWTSSDYTTADGKAAGWWWLRSPGYFQHGAALVYTDGSLNFYHVYFGLGVVRPAFWISLESGIF